MLAPCPACHRHVRTSDAECPFCTAPLPLDIERSVVPAATHRLGRSATFVFASSIALASCATTTGTTDGSTDATGESLGVDSITSDDVRPGDDVVAIDSGAGDVLAPRDVVGDDGGLLAMYGGPPDIVPQDAVRDVPADEGGSTALYGSPPPPADI